MIDTNYLTLGDGDFSYSLDLCRFLNTTITTTTTAIVSQPLSSSPIGKDQRKDDTSNQCFECLDLNNTKSICQDAPVEKDIRISCTLTGFDSLPELRQKYRDVNFILGKIKSMNYGDDADERTYDDTNVAENNIKKKNKRKRSYMDRDIIKSSIKYPQSSNTTTSMQVTIYHDINAIQPWNEESNKAYAQNQQTSSNDVTNTPKKGFFSTTYHHVIFNHPHIGKEDAQLHCRFLSHLFYSVSTLYLQRPQQNKIRTKDENADDTINDPKQLSKSNDGIHHDNNGHDNTTSAGVFHLTLVIGQCERWNCISQARKHGLILLGRQPFIPPPPPGFFHMMKKKKETNLQQRQQKEQCTGDDMNFSSASSSTPPTTTTSIQNENEYQSTIKPTPETEIDARSIDNELFKTHYHPRRHQSGKSFASRATSGSETLTFGREEDCGHHCAKSLPWQPEFNTWQEDARAILLNDDSKGQKETTTVTFKKSNQQCMASIANDILNIYKCNFCEKSFRDERARKNHIRCVHTDSGNNDKKILLTCDLCARDGSDGVKGQPPRVFANLAALEAHKKAKHFGIHTDIKPDWAAAVNSGACIPSTTTIASNDIDNSTDKQTKQDPDNTIDEHCEVCNLRFTTKSIKLQHYHEFIPCRNVAKNNKDLETLRPFKCDRCGKRFRDQRAKLQHENFCSKSICV